MKKSPTKGGDRAEKKKKEKKIKIRILLQMAKCATFESRVLDFSAPVAPPVKASSQDQTAVDLQEKKTKIPLKSVADSFTWLKAEKFKIFPGF